MRRRRRKRRKRSFKEKKDTKENNANPSKTLWYQQFRGSYTCRACMGWLIDYYEGVYKSNAPAAVTTGQNDPLAKRLRFHVE